MNEVKITGVVERVVNRSTSAGITYAMVIDGIEYGTWKNEPRVKEGDEVEFMASQKGRYWNANFRTINVVSGGNSSSRASSNASAAPKPTRPWVPDADRQNAISYQAARKDALEFVGMLVSSDNIDLGKSKSVAGKIEALEVYVDKYTMRFFEDTKNLGHKEESVEASVKSAKKDKADDAAFDDDIPF